MEKKQAKRNTSLALQILIGVLIAQLLNLMGTFLGAILQNKGILDDTGTVWYTVAIWFTASCGATMILSAILEKNWISICAVGGIHIGILLCINMLLMNNGFSGIGKGIAAIAVGLIPSFFLLRNKRSVKKNFIICVNLPFFNLHHISVTKRYLLVCKFVFKIIFHILIIAHICKFCNIKCRFGNLYFLNDILQFIYKY